MLYSFEPNELKDS